MPVVLLDTFSLLFRAHHALPPMTTRAGEPTSALYGLFSLVIKLAREHAPARFAFALDAPGPTFRAEQYREYKAGRPRTPDALSQQIARLREILPELGAPAFRSPGFEADDILATLAAVLADEGPIVVSGDRDLLQVARGSTRVRFVGRRGKDHVMYDAAAVAKRFGVAPERLPDYVALVGDPSDNLPKVPGVGARTAAAWIDKHGTIEAVLMALDTLMPARLRAAVAERADQIRRSAELATLRVDVPLPDGPRVAELDARALARTFEALEFRSLLPRLAALSEPVTTSNE